MPSRSHISVILPDATEITPSRIRLIQVVAVTFVVNGVVNLLLVFVRLVDFGFGRPLSLGWIGDILIGLGLLSFSRRAYRAARWWIALKLVLCGAWLVWLMTLGVRISQLQHRRASILATFEKAMTPAFLLLVGLVTLAVWQLWVLSRRYTRSVFGCSVIGADPDPR